MTWGWDGGECCLGSTGRSGLSEGTAEAGSARRVPLHTAFLAGLGRAPCGRWWRPLRWLTHPARTLASPKMCWRFLCKPGERRARNRRQRVGGGACKRPREEQRAGDNPVYHLLWRLRMTREQKGGVLSWRENSTGLGDLESGCWPSVRQLTLLTNGPLGLEGSR